MSIYLIAFQYVPLVNKKREKDKQHGFILDTDLCLWFDCTLDISVCWISSLDIDFREYCSVSGNNRASFDALGPLHDSMDGRVL
jgi:hypothetical protein